MLTEILSQIEDVLEQIRPALHADGGDVELVEFDDEGFVHLSMMGSCGGCPMSTATLTLGIEAELRRVDSRGRGRHHGLIAPGRFGYHGARRMSAGCGAAW